MALLRHCLLPLLLLPLTLSSAAAMPDASVLQLACEGTDWQGHAAAPGTPKPWKADLRIDLAASSFCWDVCDNSYPLAKVSASEILLVDRRGTQSWGTLRYNRKTRRIRMDMNNGDIVTIRDGRCTAQPAHP